MGRNYCTENAENTKNAIREIFTEVEAMAFTTGTRAKYQHIVELLYDMQKVKGGSEVVAEMVAKWRVKYKNRPAMMYELAQEY